MDALFCGTEVWGFLQTHRLRRTERAVRQTRRRSRESYLATHETLCSSPDQRDGTAGQSIAQKLILELHEKYADSGDIEFRDQVARDVAGIGYAGKLTNRSSAGT